MIGFLCVATTLYGWDAVGQYFMSRGHRWNVETTPADWRVAALLNASMFLWGLASIFRS